MYYAEAEMQCLKQLFANILTTKAYIQAARNVDRWMLVYCYRHAENKNTSTPVFFVTWTAGLHSHWHFQLMEPQSQIEEPQVLHMALQINLMTYISFKCIKYFYSINTNCFYSYSAMFYNKLSERFWAVSKSLLAQF